MKEHENHTWKEWYAVPDQDLGDALRAARARALEDHPDTPLMAMMTPEFRRESGQIVVFVVGKPR